MAAFSIVIIASIIGGFEDIGWEVLSSMRAGRIRPEPALRPGDRACSPWSWTASPSASPGSGGTQRPAWLDRRGAFWSVVAALLSARGFMPIDGPRRHAARSPPARGLIDAEAINQWVLGLVARLRRSARDLQERRSLFLHAAAADRHDPRGDAGLLGHCA